jgi:hypothetical protein
MTNRQPLRPHQAILDGAHLHKVHRNIDDGRRPPCRFPVQVWTHLEEASLPLWSTANGFTARWKPDDFLGSKSAELGETQEQGRSRKTSDHPRPPHRGRRRPGPKGGPKETQGHPKGAFLSKGTQKTKKKKTPRQDKTPRRRLILKCTYQKTSRFGPHRHRRRPLRPHQAALEGAHLHDACVPHRLRYTA